MLGLQKLELRARHPHSRVFPLSGQPMPPFNINHLMGVSNAIYWSRRAARMRQRAEHVADLSDQRAVMLETAQHYEMLAHYSREIHPHPGR